MIRSLLHPFFRARTPASHDIAEPAAQLPATLVADLRTDHAGETGAVMIYRGIFATTRDAALREFASQHLATESRHLDAIDAMLAPGQRSRLLPIWRVAGWLTGALPSLVGPRAVYVTIQAVETFVDEHYGQQVVTIDQLDPDQQQAPLQALRALLAACQADEVEHRDDAAARLPDRPGAVPLVQRLWVRAVDLGSRAAVAVCRRI